MSKYYNKKRSKGLDFKEGDKVQLLYKFFKSRQLSKKLDHVKLGLFRIAAKVLNLIYKLDLLAEIKIYPVQYIIILKLAHRNIKPLVYKIEMYRGQEEEEQDIQKIVNHKEVDEQLQYKVKWVGYKEITQELKENLKNAIKNVEIYYKKERRVKEKKRD